MFLSFKFGTHSLILGLTVLLASILCSCSSPSPGNSDANSIQAALDKANIALTHGDCSTALTTLAPVYNSSSSSNSVRMTMASAYACSAGVNFFVLVNQIINSASSLGSGGFWSLPPQYFPSTTSDRVVESAYYSTDALQAAITPGRVLVASSQNNVGSFNSGSDDYSDRIDDANTYLFFVSLASVGGLESRFGKPNSAFRPTQSFPWVSATQMKGDGCAFAASILNLFDGMKSASVKITSSVAVEFGTLYSTFSPAFAQACDYGCKGTASGAMDWGGTASGCAIAAGCAACPTTLRDRTSCTGLATDPNSCAAAGIVNWFMSDVTAHAVSAGYSASYTGGVDPGLGWH